MDVRDHAGNLAGPREKVTTKVAPIKVEYHFMTKQTSLFTNVQNALYIWLRWVVAAVGDST
jgi:hypothetical protein